MKKLKRQETKSDYFKALIKTFYYALALPCLLILGVITLIISSSDSFHYKLYSTDYVLLTLLWLAILIPLSVRQYGKYSRRHKLQKTVSMLTRADRFNPEKQHQVLDAGHGKYLGIDTKNGTILYIHMVKKGLIDVIGLDMQSWTNRELEGSALRLYTKMPDVPVLSVYAHPIVAKRLFDTLGAMDQNSYGKPFTDSWPVYVAQQSRFVEYEHGVVVPQAV